MPVRVEFGWRRRVDDRTGLCRRHSTTLTVDARRPHPRQDRQGPRQAAHRPDRSASPARKAGSPPTPHASTAPCSIGSRPYGKHLFYHWSTGEIGHVHLGLFGKFKVHTGDERPEPRGAVRMRLESDCGDDRSRRPHRVQRSTIPRYEAESSPGSVPTRSSPGRTRSGCTTRSPSRHAASAIC